MCLGWLKPIAGPQTLARAVGHLNIASDTVRSIRLATLTVSPHRSYMIVYSRRLLAAAPGRRYDAKLYDDAIKIAVSVRGGQSKINNVVAPYRPRINRYPPQPSPGSALVESSVSRWVGSRFSVRTFTSRSRSTGRLPALRRVKSPYQHWAATGRLNVPSVSRLVTVVPSSELDKVGSIKVFSGCDRY